MSHLHAIEVHQSFCTGTYIRIASKCIGTERNSVMSNTQLRIIQSKAGRFDLKVFVNCLQADKDLRIETSWP